MLVGVGVPCHIKDRSLLRICEQALARLDPAPCCVYVDLNDGREGLKAVRDRIFCKLFETCDVVLNCDVDFYLFPDILRHVREDTVTSFAFLSCTLSDIPQSIARLLGFGWTGCYSITRDLFFEKVKEYWDGSDTSLKHLIPSYTFVKTPKYYLLRAWRPETTASFLRNMPLDRRIRWMMTKLRG